MKQVIPFSKEIVFKTNIASITSISLEHEEKISNGEITGDFTIFGDYKIHNDTTERELFKYKLPFTAIIPDNVVQNSVSVEVENFTYETIENDVLKVNIDFVIEGEEQATEKRVEENIEEELIEASPIIEENDALESNKDEIENELNYFLDNKILSNLANIEEIRTQDNKEILEPSELVKEVKTESVIENVAPEPTEIFKEGPIFRAEIVPEENKPSEVPTEQTNSQEVKEENLKETSHECQPPEKNAPKEQREEAVKPEREETILMTNEKEINNEYVTYHIHIVKTEETIDAIMKNYNSNLDTLSIYNDVTNIKPGDKLIIPEYLDE